MKLYFRVWYIEDKEIKYLDFYEEEFLLIIKVINEKEIIRIDRIVK